MTFNLFHAHVVKQEAVLNKLNEAKEARVTLNRMRREHQDKVRQQEKEQSLLARMQMEQKLALLRQQKQEQLDFEKSLQQQRLETLQSQRTEYEQRLQAQREKERQLLIAQETQVLHQQFGSNSSGVGVAVQPSATMQPVGGVVGGAHPYAAAPPPPTSTYNPTSLQFQSLSLHDPTQAGPLPPKLDHTLGLDQSIAPPPYHPSTFHQAPPPLSLPTDSMATGYTSYQQPPPPSLQSQFHPQQHHPAGDLMGLSMNPPPQSSMAPASLHPSQMIAGQPHSLESMLNIPPMSGAGGQPSSLPSQLPSALDLHPQPEPPQQFQQGFGMPPHQQMTVGGGPPPPIMHSGGGGPPPSMQQGGGGPPPSMQMGYQQQPVSYSGQPTGGLPPPGVTYHQAPPPGSQQQFAGGAPMQMHTGGFIPNGARHGQAPPQPHPPPVGRQESQPPLISFD